MNWSLYYDMNRYRLFSFNMYESDIIQKLGSIKHSMFHDFKDDIYIRKNIDTDNPSTFFVYDSNKRFMILHDFNNKYHHLELCYDFSSRKGYFYDGYFDRGIYFINDDIIHYYDREAIKFLKEFGKSASVFDEDRKLINGMIIDKTSPELFRESMFTDCALAPDSVFKVNDKIKPFSVLVGIADKGVKGMSNYISENGKSYN